MNIPTISSKACFLGLLLVTLSSCDKTKPSAAAPSPADVNHSNALKQLWLAYQQHQNEEDSTPRKYEDLSDDARKYVDVTDLVVIWGVNVFNVPDAENTVLAYHVDVPKSGGYVAFAGGRVAHVSHEEFAKLTKATPLPNMRDRPADFSLAAAAYLSEVVKDNMAADKKFKYKTIELKGLVSDFQYGGFPRKSVQLYVEPEDDSGPKGATVCCFMSEGQPWASLAKGQAVTVKGTGPSIGPLQGLGPVLRDVVIVSSGPATLLNSSAADLLTEFQKGPDAAAMKYGEKLVSVIVTGEIIAQGKDFSNSRILLKGTAQNHVICNFRESFGKQDAAKIAPGKKVKLYAEPVKRLSDGNLVLEKCLLIDE